ncbi:uncharacterized protein LOC126577534 [Anopheles aquasalis]|uniref:uncharacterized protein LOC126577534 n=1 Tax=Anopheles aquasalis TaxID=42839 RepID=UPI00215B02A3|nr:uncharacterized protein LOC126577534 [Anopheles aquasalis]
MIRFILILLGTVVAIAQSVTGLLRCDESSFDVLGGVLPTPSNSCTHYATCIDGTVREVACPDGTSFDSTLGRCQDSAKLGVQCASPRAVSQIDGLCTNPNEVNIIPYPTNCSKYIICFGMEGIEQSCGGDLLFNPVLGMCDVPTNVICELSCPAVDDPQNPVWLPDARSEDCARHYLCFRGEPLLFICPSNLYFDTRSNTCTFPSNSTCRVSGISCPLPNSFLENPRDCTTYYQCVEGFPHLRRCGPNEYYLLFVGGCIEGVCPPSIETTTVPFTTTPTSTLVLSTTTTTETSTPMSTTTMEVSTTPATESSTPEISTTMEPTSTTGEPSTPVTETTTETIPTTFDPPTTTTVGSETTFSPTTPIETTTPMETTDFPTTSTSLETSSVTPSLPVSTTTEEMSTSESTEPATTATAPTTTPLDTTSEAPATTTVPTTIETTTMPSVDPQVVCQGISFGVRPYPDNCYMYIICLNNMGTVAECLANEIFNANTSTCIPGNRDTCTPGMRFGEI